MHSDTNNYQRYAIDYRHCYKSYCAINIVVKTYKKFLSVYGGYNLKHILCPQKASFWNAHPFFHFPCYTQQVF